MEDSEARLWQLRWSDVLFKQEPAVSARSDGRARAKGWFYVSKGLFSESGTREGLRPPRFVHDRFAETTIVLAKFSCDRILDISTAPLIFILYFILYASLRVSVYMCARARARECVYALKSFDIERWDSVRYYHTTRDKNYTYYIFHMITYFAHFHIFQTLSNKNFENMHKCNEQTKIYFRRIFSVTKR